MDTSFGFFTGVAILFLSVCFGLSYCDSRMSENRRIDKYMETLVNENKQIEQPVYVR